MEVDAEKEEGLAFVERHCQTWVVMIEYEHAAAAMEGHVAADSDENSDEEPRRLVWASRASSSVWCGYDRGKVWCARAT